MAKKSEVVNFGLGVDQLSPDTALLYDKESKQSAARNIVNADVTNSGNLKRRRGFTQVVSGTNVHSLGGTDRLVVYMDDGTLYRLNSDESATSLRTGLSPSRLMSYETINGELYFSNGEVLEKIVNGAVKLVGVEEPVGQPTLSAMSAGGLYAGDYQVAITFLNSDGEESGTGTASRVSISEGGGIRLTAIPQPVEEATTRIRVYVSPANGDMLYYFAEVAVGTTTLDIGVAPLGRALNTQFCSRMLPGRILRYYHGRLYSVIDNFIFYSDPQAYGRCKISNNFIALASNVTMLEPVETGLYISTETEVFFLGGTDPSTGYSLQRVSETPAVEGSSLVAKPEVLGIKGITGSTKVAVWFTNAGWAAGLPDGNVAFLTRDKLALPEYTQAATLHRMVDGMSQLVTIPRGNGETASAFASDSMEDVIIRNGAIVS
jgi:hypothetical protein